MGWFEEQIKERKEYDDIALEESGARVRAAITGERIGFSYQDEQVAAKSTINEILRYYHFKPRELPKNITDFEEQLEYLVHPYGMMWRWVELTSGWYRDAVGAMLGRKKSDGSLVALIPNRFFGYSFWDPETGTKIKLNKQTEGLLEKDAVCFYNPLPQTELTIPLLVKYIVENISLSTNITIQVLTLLTTLIGLLTPKITYVLYQNVVPSKSLRLLLAIAVFYISVSVSQTLIESAKSLLNNRLNTQLNVSVQAAVMARVFSLPADFFKEYSSGELSGRMGYINNLCSTLVGSIYSVSMSSVFSILYITQIFHYTPTLVVPALIVTGVTVVSTILLTVVQRKTTERLMKITTKKDGMVYALITGIQKIKLAGAEKRVFSKWLDLYSKEVKLIYNPPMLLKFQPVISLIISQVGMIVMYIAAVESHVTIADYSAFNSAYGMVSGAFMSLTGVVTTIATIGPVLKMAEPIMKTVPETTEGKRMVTRLSGNIELNNVSFRYKESDPYVINNLSLKIRSGQYVAIVGKTGCGKSTLIRLLLGFEKPQRGAIYYDGKDINSMDLKSLRRKIGTVMQNSKLFMGDIFSNITVTAPQATLDDAWEAAETVGMAEDIRDMPMGMHTMISEGAGGISGGQRQRIMIARAIAPKPRILIFDEATSALDNITQKQVSDALERLKCTRIVVAHRLSTIQQCNRILVLDKGKIIEDGTYEDLIAQDGFFKELVDRQRVDVE